MEEPSLLAEPLRDGVDEGGDVVLGLGLDLGHAGGGGSDRALGDLVDRGSGDAAQLGPALQRGQLHLEPARQLRLVRPDPGHGRTGVPRDHGADSRDDTGEHHAIAAAARAMSVR